MKPIDYQSRELWGVCVKSIVLAEEMRFHLDSWDCSGVPEALGHCSHYPFALCFCFGGGGGRADQVLILMWVTIFNLKKHTSMLSSLKIRKDWELFLKILPVPPSPYSFGTCTPLYGKCKEWDKWQRVVTQNGGGGIFWYTIDMLVKNSS